MRRVFEKLLFAVILLPALIGGNAVALSPQDKQLIDKQI